MLRKSAVIMVAICLLSISGLAQQITVAAASDLQFALADVASRFEKETGKTVKVTYGSSGNFFAQIQNGAPFDVFFSADVGYPQKLDSAGLVETGTPYEYATGKIVLWTRKESHLDVRRGLKLLLDPQIKKVAIANPEHAPYGRAAVAAMRSEGIYDQVSGKLVLGENISQTATFVISGSADAGIIALSLALAPTNKDTGDYFEIPARDYPAIRQAAVILKSSREKATAQQFLDYVKTPAIADLLRSYGFAMPESH